MVATENYEKVKEYNDALRWFTTRRECNE